MDNVLKKITEGIEYPFLLEFLNESSKRIRSRLAILYLKANGKELNDDIYTILAAGELIHNASLLHDDVIDEALLRRGKTTIANKLSYKISIVAGDYLLSYAISKILELNNSKIIKIFESCTKLMCEGEFSQYFLRGKIPSLEEYLLICENKTGALFSAILESAAIIADLDEERAKRFGMLFGLYFQIKNDLDEASAVLDKKNDIFNVKSILGIEKTSDLLDNCREEMRNILETFPEYASRQELEGLFKS